MIFNNWTNIYWESPRVRCMFSSLLSIFEPTQPDCCALTANHQTKTSPGFSPEEHILTPSFSTPRKLSSSPESPFIHSFIQSTIILLLQLPHPLPPPPPMTFPFPQTLVAWNTGVTNCSDSRAQAQIRNSHSMQARWEFWWPGQESQTMSRGHVSVCLSGQSMYLSHSWSNQWSLCRNLKPPNLCFFFFSQEKPEAQILCEFYQPFKLLVDQTKSMSGSELAYGRVLQSFPVPQVSSSLKWGQGKFLWDLSEFVFVKHLEPCLH